MEAMLSKCCGIDLHRDSIVACLLVGGLQDEPEITMQKFGTMYDDLLALAAFLSRNDCSHVAMESTSNTYRVARRIGMMRNGSPIYSAMVCCVQASCRIDRCKS